MNGSAQWAKAVAPTLEDFERMAASAWDQVPSHFREMAGDLVIRVEDFADDDILNQLDIEDPFDLTGIYKGVNLDHKSSLDTAQQPDMVFLYRRPILDEWSEGGEELGHLVAHVLIHEIGHHFGFSDEDMEALESEM